LLPGLPKYYNQVCDQETLVCLQLPSASYSLLSHQRLRELSVCGQGSPCGSEETEGQTVQYDFCIPLVGQEQKKGDHATGDWSTIKKMTCVAPDPSRRRPRPRSRAKGSRALYTPVRNYGATSRTAQAGQVSQVYPHVRNASCLRRKTWVSLGKAQRNK